MAIFDTGRTPQTSWKKHLWRTKEVAVSIGHTTTILPCQCHWTKRVLFLFQELFKPSPRLDYYPVRAFDFKTGSWYFFVDYRGSGLRKYSLPHHGIKMELSLGKEKQLATIFQVIVDINKYQIHIVLGKHNQ